MGRRGQDMNCTPGQEDVWKRPSFTHVNARADALIFQQVDCDYYTEGEQPVIRIFGVTDKGNSVCCFVRGFSHYLYVRMPEHWPSTPDQKMVEKLKEEFNKAVGRSYGNQGGKYVHDVKPVKKESLKGWSTKGQSWFLRVKFTMPQYVNKARRLLPENSFTFNGQTARFNEVFEANVPYVLRFMVDSSVVGGGWIELPAGK